jgi:hypothetical protein
MGWPGQDMRSGHELCWSGHGLDLGWSGLDSSVGWACLPGNGLSITCVGLAMG